jgi:hypothetical protein
MAGKSADNGHHFTRQCVDRIYTNLPETESRRNLFGPSGGGAGAIGDRGEADGSRKGLNGEEQASNAPVIEP